jgi:hypothetical protein
MLELKIPAQRFDQALNGLATLGKVESVNATAEDVGEEYVDITARVNNAHRLEDRLIACSRRERESFRTFYRSNASSRACARRSSATRDAFVSSSRASRRALYR